MHQLMLTSETQRGITLEKLDNETKKWPRFTSEGLHSVWTMGPQVISCGLNLPPPCLFLCSLWGKNVFTCFNVWKNKQKGDNLWYVKMTWNSNCSASEASLGHTHAHGFLPVYGWFCYRSSVEQMPQRPPGPWTLTYLLPGPLRENVPTPGLQEDWHANK